MGLGGVPPPRCNLPPPALDGPLDQGPGEAGEEAGEQDWEDPVSYPACHAPGCEGLPEICQGREGGAEGGGAPVGGRPPEHPPGDQGREGKNFFQDEGSCQEHAKGQHLPPGLPGPKDQVAAQRGAQGLGLVQNVEGDRI